VRGNALQLAKLRFEGRYPETTQSLITTFENIIKERNLRSVIEYKEKLGESDSSNSNCLYPSKQFSNENLF